MNKIQFLLGNKLTEINFDKQTELNTNTTVLNYLRTLDNRKSVKEGCAEGDCGACTVVLGELENNNLTYKAYNSCLLFLPVLHGKQLLTAEDLAEETKLHPVQQAMIETDGSQCGYCTPGFVMSLFSIYKNFKLPTQNDILDALSGNLCRCTGYRPIIEAAKKSYEYDFVDKFEKNKIEIIQKLSKISKQELEIITNEYKYFLPQTLEQAINLKTNNSNTLIINGSTDIALRVTKRKETIAEIIDISNINAIKNIEENQNEYIVGAGVTLNQLKDFSEDKMPALYKMLSVFGAKQIRNKATIGGNVATASPIGDISMTLLAYNSKVLILGTEERTMFLNEFITGYRKTELKTNELIKAIIIPKYTSENIIKTYKISKRKDLDISTVSAAFNLVLENNIVKNILISYGGMSAMTKRAYQIETFLQNKEWTEQNIFLAQQIIDEEFTPISDARSSAKARSIMAKNLLIKFFIEIQI